MKKKDPRPQDEGVEIHTWISNRNLFSIFFKDGNLLFFINLFTDLSSLICLLILCL